MVIFRGRLSTIRWRTRITLWLAALLAGLAVVAFAKLADIALTVFSFLTSHRPWLPFLLTSAIGMIVVCLTRRYVSGAQGSGICRVL